MRDFVAMCYLHSIKQFKPFSQYSLVLKLKFKQSRNGSYTLYLDYKDSSTCLFGCIKSIAGRKLQSYSSVTVQRAIFPLIASIHLESKSAEFAWNTSDRS